jgi:predicted negative regulator of RcsB-dependent stress response
MDDADAGYASSGAAPAASQPAPSTTPPATAATTTTGTTTRTSTLSDRAGALAFDYNSAWYTRYADVTTAWNAAAALEKAKDYNGAVATYAPFLSDSRVDVAQDAAWRTARDLWTRGDASAALLTVEGGLARGGGDSAYRVHLLVLQGDLFNAMGRPADAAKAWAEGARLNRERSAARTGTKAAPPK